MRKLNILIVEDDPKVVVGIKESLAKLGDFEIFIADNEVDGWTIANENNIDLFFMNGQLKNSSGFELTRRLRATVKYTLAVIVFVSVDPSYLLDMSVLRADYIIKPFAWADFERRVSLILKQMDSPAKGRTVLMVDSRRRLRIMVNFEDIIYIRAIVSGSEIVTLKEKLSTPKRLNELAESLDNRFFRCHKSYIANLQHVRNIDGKNSMVNFKSTETKIPVGRHYLDDTIKKIKSIT